MICCRGFLIEKALCGGEFLFEKALCKEISVLKRLCVKVFTYLLIEKLSAEGLPY